ncbi:unnamed protein product [Moneuplotes crassus]|uniref:Cyclin-dependent kinase 2 homolog n=1 Tax=Euplotes crassus TaxID=5936 RepID=A0AAD1XMI3_EUPCR|nr:unnamed protein product [Moneuplotes crassus]
MEKNNPEEFKVPFSPLLIGRYKMIKKIGKGSYGSVYKVEDIKDRKTATTPDSPKKYFAVKKMKLPANRLKIQGIDFTTLREINILQEIKHENIIPLVDVFHINRSTFMVMELMKSDLSKLMFSRTITLTIPHIKCIMLQIFYGLKELHKNWIIHRDLTPNNLLISEDGVLKFSDFGLSRFFASNNRPMTQNVVTLHYRAPEILFGANYYGPQIDIFSAGCILGGLLLRGTLFCGRNDIDQMSQIFKIMGTPSEETWEGVTNLPHYVEFEETPPQSFRILFPGIDEDLANLLEGLLVLDPNKRLTVEQCINHPFFNKSPDSCDPDELPMDDIS